MGTVVTMMTVICIHIQPLLLGALSGIWVVYTPCPRSPSPALVSPPPSSPNLTYLPLGCAATCSAASSGLHRRTTTLRSAKRRSIRLAVPS